jgi:hypothetical protein
MDGAAKIVAWVGATILVAAYVVLLILQFGHLGVDDGEWNRRLQLLNPLEALAFAAAGVLLGTAVQKQATKEAQDLAKENQEIATRGKLLAAAVEAKADAPGPTPPEIKELEPLAKEI